MYPWVTVIVHTSQLTQVVSRVAHKLCARSRGRVANIPDTTAAMPKRGPAHPGLSSIDPFGALVVICCTIIFAAWLFHDTPVQHVVAAVVAFYAVFALAVAIVCRNSKVSQS